MTTVAKIAAWVIPAALVIYLAGIFAFNRLQESDSRPVGTTEVSANPTRRGPAPAKAIPLSRAPEMLGRERSLKEEREDLDKTVWAMESAAQEHEETVIKYWDRMVRRTDDKFAVLAQVPFEEITLGAAQKSDTLD